jgi:hypothetical protein
MNDNYHNKNVVLDDNTHDIYHNDFNIDNVTIQSNLQNPPNKNPNNVFIDGTGNHVDGSNFSVVIIDTGIDKNHPFFGPDKDGDGVADRIVYQYDFSGSNDNDATDYNNHGSHVASIAASSDAKYPGIAPGADIIVLKVFEDNGNGSFFDVEEAVQWVVDNTETYNIASVNMSLSNTRNYTNPTNISFRNSITGKNSSLSDEIQALTDKGVIVVSAAGNAGQIGVSYPAADKNSLAVSSVNSNGVIASSSQYHPTLTDVFATGVGITAANRNGGTTTLSGTSMAAPQVAGAIAIAQQLATRELGRRLTLDEIRDLLKQGDNVTGFSAVHNEEDYEGKLLNIEKLGEAILKLDTSHDTSTHLTLEVNDKEQFGRLLSYGGIEQNPQDKKSVENSLVEITDNGNVLTLQGNRWSRVELDYEITEKTVLEFEFESLQEGEIHAIGFDNDNSVSEMNQFQLFGTDNWKGSEQAFNTYQADSGLQSYRIEVGKYVSLGNYEFLTFTADDDVDSPNAFSRFSNIRIYESVETTTQENPQLNLTATIAKKTQQFELQSYGGETENTNLQLTLNEEKDGLEMTGNGWQKILIDYNITENTRLKFDFKSTSEGEIQGIGFDNDNFIDSTGVTDSNNFFKVYGTQDWGINDFDNYDFNSTVDGITTYEINLGDYSDLWGQFQYLTLANDDDLNESAVSNISNIQLYEVDKLTVTVEETPQEVELQAYGGETENTNLEVTLNEENNGLEMIGNGWQKILIDYNITENTRLKFDFKSTTEGQIQGIGFDNDNFIDSTGVTDSNNFFKVYGTQDWGINDFDNYDFDSTTDGITTYEINVGDYLSGQFQYLTLANDDDLNENAVSNISNIQLYESIPDPEPEEIPTDLIVTVGDIAQKFEPQSYGGITQNSNLEVKLSQSGGVLDMIGNGWQKILIDYNITDKTILEFDFQGTEEGEIHGIGFDGNDIIENSDQGQFFKVYGTQEWGRPNFDNYSPDGITNYKINVGAFFTGSFQYMTFANDDDRIALNADNYAKFSNIKIYEDDSLGTSSNQIDSNDDQVDLLIGTTEKDVFSLGNSNSPLYNQNGNQDYALIQGFDVNEDIIELHGEKDDYFLSPSSGELPNGTSIFWNTDEGYDLLGIVENVDTLSFENYADNFAFV